MKVITLSIPLGKISTTRLNEATKNASVHRAPGDVL